MIRRTFDPKTNLTFCESNNIYEGETIEEKIDRMMTTEGGVTDDDNVELLFTEKKDGVHPEYNIRTDKWDMALEAMDEVNMSKRQHSIESASKNEDGNTTE